MSVLYNGVFCGFVRCMRRYSLVEEAASRKRRPMSLALKTTFELLEILECPFYVKIKACAVYKYLSRCQPFHHHLHGILAHRDKEMGNTPFSL